MAPQKSKPKPKPNKKAPAQKQPTLPPSLPLDLQQLLLNIFKNAFPERLTEDIKPVLQQVKGHLYNREFGAAFGKREYLEAYALRWSPSRALCYLDVLSGLGGEVKGYGFGNQETEEEEWNVVCVGGGAGAEIVALGGLSKILGADNGVKIKATGVDIADWTDVFEKLRDGIVTKPPLSKYASAAAQAANTALADSARFSVEFRQHDVLNMEAASLSNMVEKANLVTLMFTLNELYTTSLSLTQKFLLNLTTSLKQDAWLLVVDSPGSYSTVRLNGAEKKYPMQWLLDHTLLGTGANGAVEVPKWEKVQEEESKWFRLDERLRYPIELENMRYQLHLYRRI